MGVNEEYIIAITSDTDWANDEIINYMLSILDEYDIKITFFCTHEVSIDKKHELAIHPNFTKDKSEKETIQELLLIFPNAKGIRSHCLYLHTRMFEFYREFGLKYDSNYILPNQVLYPFFISKDILELPMFFEDDLYFSVSNNFDINNLNLENNGLKIFNFHPIHIFLNTRSNKYYEKAKIYLHEPRKLIKYRNTSKKGTCDMFRDLCSYIKDNNLKTYLLYEINAMWRYTVTEKNIGRKGGGDRNE